MARQRLNLEIEEADSARFRGVLVREAVRRIAMVVARESDITYGFALKVIKANIEAHMAANDSFYARGIRQAYRLLRDGRHELTEPASRPLKWPEDRLLSLGDTR